MKSATQDRYCPDRLGLRTGGSGPIHVYMSVANGLDNGLADGLAYGLDNGLA